jgi:hypothetical protein
VLVSKEVRKISGKRGAKARIVRAIKILNEENEVNMAPSRGLKKQKSHLLRRYDF